jgi:alpha-glucosidase
LIGKSVIRYLATLALVSGLASRSNGAATLTWDSAPGSAGVQDGNGSWGSTPAGTNWWDGAADQAWTNGSVPVLGLNSTTNVTVTLTNSVTVGGLVYSNTAAGGYTIGVANGATLSFAGPTPEVQLSSAVSALQVVNPSLIAPGGLSIRSTLTASTIALNFRPTSSANSILGSLSIGTPGNASYSSPTALYVDFNTATLANVLNTTTNVTVCSNATLRISGQNGSAYNLSFPKKFIISGDGQAGLRGAWLITGDAGGTFNANVALAGDSTIMTTVGSGGAPTFTLNGAISGTGNLRLANDTTYVSQPTLVLPAGPAGYDGAQTTIGGNLTVRLQSGDNRLATNSTLNLGIGNAPAGATWNGYGRLRLGTGTTPVNQTFAGLTAGNVGGAIVGGSSSGISLLTINATGNSTFSGTLGGDSSPDNRVGLLKTGPGQLSLTGSNQCLGGFTVNSGTLVFGDGVLDQPLSGSITNNGTVIFNVATNLTRDELLTGSGTIVKVGNGTLLLNATNWCPITVSNGMLGGNGLLNGSVAIQTNGTLSPGAGIGILTISNTLTLAGTTVIELDKVGLTNDSIRGLSSVTYGGTLVLNILAGNYAVGDSFKLFDASSYAGSFASFVPALPGPGRAWDTSTLTNDGTLRIITNSTLNHPPAWLSNPLTRADAPTNVAYADTLAGSASDPDVGDTLAFSKVGGPAWLNVAANGALTGTPGQGDLGTNTFTVRVTDSGGLSNDASLLIAVVADLDAPTQLSSPDGSLVLTFAVSNFDSSVSCPVYSVSWNGQPILAPSKLALTFGGAVWRDNVTVTSRPVSANDSSWSPVWGERSLVRDRYNQMVVTMQETVAPNRIVQATFRCYDEGVAFCYTIPAQVGLTNASSLTEQTEFRFTGDHTAWSVTSAQGNYATTTISGLANGNERPLTVQMATNLFLSLGEARLVDYARMKFNQLGKPNSLVSSLSSSVTSALPLRSPWRFVMAADSPGHLLEHDDLVLNLNDPCLLTNTSWIKPGKVIRDVSLTTAGGMACVDFATRHKLQYIEFDAGWYGPENTTTDATQVNVDPARSPGPLDLQSVINYGNSNGIGTILYVNQVALTPQIDILPALYRSWGVKGMKFGFVTVGPQANTIWLHESFRKCATNNIMVDAHDEIRPTGYGRTYPNIMTLEGISGDETTPSTAQDTTLLFTRMLAGPADHTVCFYDPRVTNNWNHAYQLAKAVCFFSSWQFLYWYDRPTNSPGYGTVGSAIIEDPALEFYDALPTVWDDTKVIQGSIAQYAVIARRSGDDWFIGAMNAGTTRTLDVPLNFLTGGRSYIANRYSHDPAATNATQVKITRTLVTGADTLQTTLTASSGEAMWLTPVAQPGFTVISILPDRNISLVVTGKLGQPFSLLAASNVASPNLGWSLLSTGTLANAPATVEDRTATNSPARFYRLTTP